MSKFSMEAKVGIFFLAVLAIFAYVWFKVLDLTLVEGFILKARFKTVEGLASGASVQIAGIKVGTVKDIQYDPDSGKAVVIMEFKDAYKNIIPEDSRITLRSKGLMGDKVIIIDPGKPNARKLKANEEFRMVSEPTDPEKVLDSMGVVAQDLQALTREARRQIVDEKGSERVESLITNADATFKGLREILDTNKEKISSTVDNADVATKDLREMVARNKDKINHTIDEMEKFSKGMDKTSNKFGRVADELETITKDVRGGRGTLGRLVADEALYRDAHALVRDMRGITKSIQYGQGTVGRLINDPEMYYEARRAVRNMNKTAEDISEATPISTLATILGAVLK
ncbi:MAG: MCE family protein [Desulfomonile tiedjei]|uniref:MCE family protein n=1 Tax=Desulfomonile tiedjei TaxID=2358 RepID=A0A9D6V1I9_9BACT|nr:MCE family protein [Desulfomonile tiedjei]